MSPQARDVLPAGIRRRLFTTFLDHWLSLLTHVSFRGGQRRGLSLLAVSDQAGGEV